MVQRAGNRISGTTAGRAAVLAASTALLLGSAAPAAATPGGNDGKVTLCHATESDSNPYVEITVAAAGAYNAHYRQHADLGEGDIIPPFTYQGQTYSLNWDASGQATFANGCTVPAGGANTGNSTQAGNPADGQKVTGGAKPEGPAGGQPTAVGPIPKAADAGGGPTDTWQVTIGLALASLGALAGGTALFGRRQAEG
jgi:hypothetical protein